MTWSVAAFLLAAVLKFGSRWRNIIMVFACLVTLVMTGSRYGLLNTSLAIILIFVLLLKNAKQRKASLIFLFALLPVLIVTGYLVANSNRATSERLRTLRNPFTTDSLRDRLDHLWRDAEEEIAQSPFLGHGPAKTIFSRVVGTNSAGATWALHLGFVIVLSALVMNVGMSTFYSASLQAFIWMWLGIGAGTLRMRA